MGCAGATECGVENPKWFDEINGTPIRYGSPGNYDRKEVKAGTGFHDKLVNWIQTLRYFSDQFAGDWFNRIEWLGHAGAYVCKDGCHGQGRAFDLNYVKWNGYELNIFGGAHAADDKTRRRRYLAVDGCCRRYFKYTLDGWYNASHHNHIHIDNHTVPIMSRDSESDTKFVQAVCNNFNGAGLAIDGAWGPNTQDAFEKINREWGYPRECNPANNHNDWVEWCNQVMRHGFNDATAGKYNSSCGGEPTEP